MNEIETCCSSNLICLDLKQEEIIKNVKFLRKYRFTNTYWYDNVLPTILKRVKLSWRLKKTK